MRFLGATKYQVGISPEDIDCVCQNQTRKATIYITIISRKPSYEAAIQMDMNLYSVLLIYQEKKMKLFFRDPKSVIQRTGGV